MLNYDSSKKKHQLKSEVRVWKLESELNAMTNCCLVSDSHGTMYNSVHIVLTSTAV